MLHVHAQVGSYLVVSGPCRVQPPRRGPDLVRQARFDVHVDVFELGFQLDTRLLQLVLDERQGFLNNPVQIDVAEGSRGSSREIQEGVDNRLANAGFKAEGILIGDYEFKEDSMQKHSGVFQGIMMLYWYVVKPGIIHFDDIEMHVSDGYCNNQHCGTWTAYGESIPKVCNWGMYRIPFSGDLDIGAGEFSPNSKYYSNGWKDFTQE